MEFVYDFEKNNNYIHDRECQFIDSRNMYFEEMSPFLNDWGITKDDFVNCHVDFDEWMRDQRVFRNPDEVLAVLDWCNRFESTINKQRTKSVNWLSRSQMLIEDWKQRIGKGFCGLSYRQALSGKKDQQLYDVFTDYDTDSPTLKRAFTEFLMGVGIAYMLRKIEAEYAILSENEKVSIKGNTANNSLVQPNQEMMQARFKCIDWKGSQVQLVYLFSQLEQCGLVHIPHLFATLPQHFTANGKSMNRDSLKSNFNKSAYLSMTANSKNEGARKMDEIRRSLQDAAEYLKNSG